MKLISRISGDNDPESRIDMECAECPWDTHLLGVCWHGWVILVLVVCALAAIVGVG